MPSMLSPTTEELRAERLALMDRLRQIDTELQALCQHKWAWYPIAGEGKICLICGLRDHCED